ncbi:MAG TPA: tripartite tricarboxylate transporter substrate-binding protein, partial [Burkholderiales bacterium]|nr:tripartite tricarboxylate transporter substrate-binding protein [Burkholderiales bacterium]
MLFVLLAISASALAQFPSRPITIIVPIPPGGAPDIAARVIADKLSQNMGHPVVVENKAGANGNIANEFVARAQPDGHTLGLLADSQITVNPHLYKMPIDTLRDLAPVVTVAANQFVLTVNPSLPVRNFPEFIAYAKTANPPLAYASGGNGSQHHLTMEMLKRRAGINLLHVPFKGGAPAAAATVAGDTVAVWSGSSTAPQIKAGRLRPLAVSGAQRSEQYPELPTIGEFYPGFENSIWLGLFGPANIPPDVLGKLRAELRKVLEAPDVKQKMNAAGGLDPYLTTPEEFSALIRRDYEKYAKVVKDIGIKVD